jgi:hypothetical protein
MANKFIIKIDEKSQNEYVELLPGDVEKTKKGGLKSVQQKTFENKKHFALHEGVTDLTSLCTTPQCFVCTLKLAKSKRPANANPALFLQAKRIFNPVDEFWFTQTPMGHNLLGDMTSTLIKQLSEQDQLRFAPSIGKYTSQSFRHIGIARQRAAGFLFYFLLFL